jgi:hypothetical protein
MVAFDAGGFRSLPAVLRRRILLGLIEQFGGDVRNDTLEALDAATQSSSNATIAIARLTCCSAYGELLIGESSTITRHVIHRTLTRHPLINADMMVTEGVPYTFPAYGDPSWYALTIFRCPVAVVHASGRMIRQTVWLRLATDAPLQIRRRLPGDRFASPAAARPIRLKEYFARQDIPVSVRDQVPLLTAEDAICWVVGYDIAVPFAADAGTATHVAVLTVGERAMAGSTREEAERQTCG